MRNWFIDGILIWEQGTCRILGAVSGEEHIIVARRNRIRGNVQFILWRAGEQGHKKDYWHDLDKSHWPYFESNEKETIKL